MFHTFGDSHSRCGFEKLHNIQVNHLGPKLCYSFGRDKLNCLNIKNYGINDGDGVIFCFGEIDCRAQIYKYVNEDNSYQSIIDKMVDEYFVAIELNVSQYNNIDTLIYFLPPQWQDLEQGKIFGLTQEKMDKHIFTKNHDDTIPWKGTNQDRKIYFDYFYQRIKENALKYKYRVLDVYREYMDERGFLNTEFSDNNVHVQDPVYIKKFLEYNRS